MTPEKNSSIRKEVNKAKSKVAKNFFQVGLATSMILGAPACVPTEATSIIPTGETNPLPGDSTKTAESPTEATYEVTSTPGIESTINPPTQVATEMPTAIATEMPTPTKVPTEVPTATAEPTATKEPTVAPTEKPLIEGNIFFDPQSEADLAKVVESPSPIDNPKEFAVWQDEYLKQVNEELETYEGNVINGSYTGTDFEGANLVLHGGPRDEGETLEVVASYQFEWQGHKIVTKTYAMETRDGSLVPFSVAFSNLPRKNTYGLVTPPGKVTVYINYDYVVTPSQIEDPFSESFFKAQKDNIDLDTQRRFLSGLSGDEVEKDKEKFSRMPFVLWAYLDSY